MFESLDADTRTRKTAPITITKVGSDYTNIVSHFRDHQFIDTLHYVPEHLSRFVAVVQSDGGEYIINAAGTMPDKMRFRLDSDSTQGIKVIIQYTTAGDNQVWIGGNK